MLYIQNMEEVYTSRALIAFFQAPCRLSSAPGEAPLSTGTQCHQPALSRSSKVSQDSPLTKADLRLSSRDS